MRLSAIGFVLLSTLCIVNIPARAQDAHDHAQGQYGQGHSENHDWYKELKQPGTGYSCCNGRSNTSDGDCRPTRAYLNDVARKVIHDAMARRIVMRLFGACDEA